MTDLRVKLQDKGHLRQYTFTDVRRRPAWQAKAVHLGANSGEMRNLIASGEPQTGPKTACNHRSNPRVVCFAHFGLKLEQKRSIWPTLETWRLTEAKNPSKRPKNVENDPPEHNELFKRRYCGRFLPLPGTRVLHSMHPGSSASLENPVQRPNIHLSSATALNGTQQRPN